MNIDAISRSWNAERKHRRESAGNRRIVCGLRCGNAVESAFTEHFRVPTEAPLDDIGEKSCDRCAGTGHKPDHKTDRRTAKHRHAALRPFGGRHPHVAQLRRDRLLGVDLFQRDKNLRNAEQSDRHRQEIETIDEIAIAEGEPRVAGYGIRPDRADREANGAHQQSFRRRTCPETRRCDDA